MSRGFALLLAGVALAGTVSAQQLDYGHNPPVGPAVAEFAADFPLLLDSEWEIPLGGFGGTRRGENPGHVPVIFVHGNNVDACDWKLVRDDFRTAGWSDQALWALSYNGLGNDVGNYSLRPDQRCRDEHAERNGGDSVSRITANDINVPDLYAFILAVREYTGERRFSLVAHSLGVTVARKTLKVYPELRPDLVAFVGIAGANHGTTLCSPGSEFVLYGCDELTPGSDWLAALNGEAGSDETYAPARWMTLYDGTGTGDGAYAPPDEKSPRLEGADNREYPGMAHNGLRVDAALVAEYRLFLESAEAHTQTHGDAHMLNQSGGGALSLLTLLMLALRAARGRPGSTRFGSVLACAAGLGAGGLFAVAPAAAAPPAPPPQPAPAAFPPDLPALTDAEHGFALGGFGGQAGMSPNHVPVIFVHGNTADACSWKLVADDFSAAGWNPQSLWALSYNGVGADKDQAPGRPDPRCPQQRTGNGGDGIPRITSNEVNVADLHAFIQAVRGYTGSAQFSLVSHSLGVTLARRVLQKYPELQADLVAFVGIAGGNHGTSLCPPGTETLFPVCAELQAGSAWLNALNGDEQAAAFAPARWMMIYDGTGGGDIAYQGALAESPALMGASNRDFPGVSHNDLRVLPEIVATYREFLEASEAARARHCHPAQRFYQRPFTHPRAGCE